MTQDKILTLKEALEPLASLKSADKKIIYAQGYFDLFHIGHVYHLKKAKQLGDILVVGVVAGRFFNKRMNQPIFTEKERMKFVAVLDCVDYVVLVEAPDAVEVISRIRPMIYAKGEDVKFKAANPDENLYREIKTIEALGGAVNFTKSLAIHSSDIIAKLSAEEIAELRDELRTATDFKEWVKNHLFNSYCYQDIQVKNIYENL